MLGKSGKENFRCPCANAYARSLLPDRMLRTRAIDAHAHTFVLIEYLWGDAAVQLLALL